LAKQGKSHTFTLTDVSFGGDSGQIPDPADVAGPLSHADGPAGIQEVEGVGTFQAVIVSGQDQIPFRRPDGLGLIGVEQFSQHVHIGDFKVVGREFNLSPVMNIPVLDLLVPLQIIDIIDSLDDMAMRSMP